MSTTSRTYFTIDFLTKSIVGTKTSFDRASRGRGKEYNELMAKMTAHPNFGTAIKEQKIEKTKRTYSGMNFKFMIAYIRMQPDAEMLMKKYEAVKRQAQNNGAPVYPIVKKWFLKTFSTEDAPFDMAAAKEAISEYDIRSAENSVDQENATILPAIPETMATAS